MDPLLGGGIAIATLVIGYFGLKHQAKQSSIEQERILKEREHDLRDEFEEKLANKTALITQRVDSMEKHQEKRDEQITLSLEKLFEGQEEQGKLLVELVTTLKVQQEVRS